MPANLGWRDAIAETLTSAREPLHYTEIAELIIEKGLRTDFGATPAATVNANISTSIKEDGEASPFIRTGKGFYALRSIGNHQAIPTLVLPDLSEDTDETGLINALGMYWRRDRVHWATLPKILGQQQSGSKQVDFCAQTGVYLLHEGSRVVYVGRTTDQPLGKRLAQHTSDRLNGRWDRFSWFGICRVKEDGTLEPCNSANFTLEMLIVTMEALLIEGLEPPQNRQRGQEFKAIEYLQCEDPFIEKNKALAIVERLKLQLSNNDI